MFGGNASENSSLNNDSMTKMYDELSLKPHMIKNINGIAIDSRQRNKKPRHGAVNLSGSKNFNKQANKLLNTNSSAKSISQKSLRNS